MPRLLRSRSTSKPAEQAAKDTSKSSRSCAASNPLMLPPGHPNTQQHLKEESGNRVYTPAASKKSMNLTRDEKSGLISEKRTKSSRSLKELLERDGGKSSRKMSEANGEQPIKKSKSSTSLSALLSRPKSSKGTKEGNVHVQQNKENRTPRASADIAPPPIWAQFATHGLPDSSGATKVPLNDRSDRNEQIALYTPQNHSPSKQQNFEEQPTLSRRAEPKPRPRSECLASNSSHGPFTETLSGLRKSARDKGQIACADQDSDDRDSSRRPSSKHGKVDTASGHADFEGGKRGSRVMAAVAAFNGKIKDLPKEPVEEPSTFELDPKAIETAFESLLDARNVPQNTRDKMRTLDTNIKADFIKQDRTGSGSAASTEGSTMQSSRPSTGKRSQTEDNTCVGAAKSHGSSERAETPNKSRSRSRTFTLSKGEQFPAKKQKSERPSSHQRTKSGELKSSSSSRSLADMASSSLLNKANALVTPQDCINYLQKVQEPRKVEVGKIHKLRQLLRNETVGWVDFFISEGGMTETVELFYRIIKVEWREDHEDALLHETLLCLKALSTTSLALESISSIQNSLFPTLLGMLFDPAKKGPSEFTTRTTIMTLLATYLASSTSESLATRARTLLTYLRDPSAPEENQPPTFIATIYHPRPYRRWCKELSDVTKEVFWVFLHPTNIIPYPSTPTFDSTSNDTDYTARHFPSPHAPVPAAPYIGGVEWDSTWYLTSHLDLLNAILASLQTKEERNAVRQELRDSGFEKVMGGTLRTCKEKFYPSVHTALTNWVGAAAEDEWGVKDVSQGPPREARSPVKSPVKKKGKVDEAPKLEMPKLELGIERDGNEGGWL